MSKNIVFIEHAVERMKEREITEEQVIDAIDNPDHVDQGYGGRKVAQKIINRKLLRVIYEEHENKIRHM